MEKIIFDTNFILTCVKEKIDFINDLEGYQLLLPEQVIKEMEKISVDRKKKVAERELAKLSLAIIEHNKSKFRMIELEKKFVDAGLLRLKEPGELIIATLDRQLKSMLKGKFKTLTITKRKKLEIVG